jgi:hypothetical protein
MAKPKLEITPPVRSILSTPSEEKVGKPNSGGQGTSTMASLATETLVRGLINKEETETNEHNEGLPTTTLRFKSPASTPKASMSKSTASKLGKKVMKKKILFSDAAKETPKLKEVKVPVTLHSVVVTFNIRVAKGTDPNKEFNKQLALAVKTIRDHLDNEARFIPLEENLSKETKVIKSMQDILALIMGQKKYFDIPNPGAFNSLSQGSRMIKGSARMCFSLEPMDVLSQAGPDLWNMDCGIYYKKLQMVKTVAEIVLLSAPMLMNKEELEKVVTLELKRIEKGENNFSMWDVKFKISK